MSNDEPRTSLLGTRHLCGGWAHQGSVCKMLDRTQRWCQFVHLQSRASRVTRLWMRKPYHLAEWRHGERACIFFLAYGAPDGESDNSICASQLVMNWMKGNKLGVVVHSSAGISTKQTRRSFEAVHCDGQCKGVSHYGRVGAREVHEIVPPNFNRNKRNSLLIYDNSVVVTMNSELTFSVQKFWRSVT